MAGNYLKSLQLAKQLEERAKEATKHKKLAEEEHDSLQKFLKLCEDNDVDLSEQKKSLGEFAASMASKDYETAVGQARTAHETAKGTFIKKLADVAASVEEILSLIKGPEAESKGALELLDKSKKSAAEDDLESAMKHAKNAYDAAERTFHEHFSEMYSQAQEVMNQAREIGEDVDLYEDLLSRSKAALGKQEYEQSITQLEEALEGAGENVKNQVNDTITRAEDLVSAGEELGVEMSRVASHLERAKSSLESMKYKDSLGYAKRAENEGEKIISKTLHNLAKETRDSIREMKAYGQDLAEPQELLDEVLDAIREKRFLEALNTVNVVRDKMHDIQFNAVLGMLAKAKNKFVLAKKVGVDMSGPLRLLNSARDSLKQGSFEEAIKLAEQSEDEIEASLEVFYKARDELVELAKAIKAAQGMDTDTSEMKQFLAEAKKAFEEKDYDKTAVSTRTGLGIARKSSYDLARTTIDDTDKAIKLGREIGADLTEAEGTLQQALDFMSEENLVGSVKLGRVSLEAANTALTTYLTDRLQSIEDFSKGLSTDDGDEVVSEVLSDISSTRDLVTSGEFEEANDRIRKIGDKLEKKGQEECERLLVIASERIETARSMGAEVGDLEVMITRARDNLTQKIFEEANARTKEVISLADDLMTRLLQAEFSSIKDSLEESKTLGIHSKEAKGRLKEARTHADAKEFAEAHTVITDTKKFLNDQIAKHDQVREKIRKAEELIVEAERNKADISGLSDELDLAKNAFSSGRLDESDQSLDALIDETEKKLAMYLAARIILASKENVDLAETNDIEVSDAKDLLTEAKELMKGKSYDEALAKGKQCEESVSAALEFGVHEKMKDIQRLVTDAKNVGVDTDSPEKLIEKAASLIKKDEFPEALQCLNSAKEDIDHVKNLSSQAAVDIKVARANLKDAETLNMDVGKARELLEQSVDAMTRHQYAIALELAKKSSDTSIDVTKSSIWNTLERFKGRIELAASEGAHVGLAERCVAEGIEAFNAAKYQDSLKLAMRCEAEMERAELQRDISSRAVENARKKLAEATTEGIKSDRLKELVTQAEVYLSEGKYVEALATAIESGDALHQIRENFDRARIEFSAVREQVERLKKVNIDTSECDEILDSAHDHLASQDFARFREAMSRCSSLTGTKFEDSIEDVMIKTREMIGSAKSMGVNAKSCEDLLEVAKTSFEEKLWDFAYQQAQACSNMCTDLIGKKLSNLIGEAENRLAMLDSLGASPDQIRDAIAQAKTANESGDRFEAFQTLMDLDQRISNIEDSHKRYVDISIAAESAIENLKHIDIPSREAERLLALAELEMEKDYDSAIELVAEALDTAKSILNSYFPDLTGAISADGMQEGAEGEMTVTINNVGRATGKDFSFQVEGDFDQVDMPGLDTIRPGESGSTTLRVKPRSSGDLTAKVVVTVKRSFDGRMDTFDFERHIKVYPAGPPFKIGRASEVSRCVSCQGKIKPGFDTVSCRCGNQLHLACAKRAGKCPVCGQEYSF
ncbi:MAG TPA: hypothetical protein VMY17_00290 [Thermoplasmata archaeon]|nr:hypothetical protein [Thermoplasmata archaeon]